MTPAFRRLWLRVPREHRLALRQLPPDDAIAIAEAVEAAISAAVLSGLVLGSGLGAGAVLMAVSLFGG